MIKQLSIPLVFAGFGDSCNLSVAADLGLDIDKCWCNYFWCHEFGDIHSNAVVPGDGWETPDTHYFRDARSRSLDTPSPDDVPSMGLGNVASGRHSPLAHTPVLEMDVEGRCLGIAYLLLVDHTHMLASKTGLVRFHTSWEIIHVLPSQAPRYAASFRAKA